MQVLTNENRARIRSVIRRMTGHVNEDLEQEALLKTWENRNAYRAENGSFKAWLTVLTANLCRDYFRSARYKSVVLQSSLEEGGEVPSRAYSQEEIVDLKKRRKLVLKAVDSLPQKMREVIVFFEFEEMSYEEIAKRLNISVGTVKSRLFAARSVLSKKLEYLKGE